MTRHLDAEHEERESARRDQLIKAVEYGLVTALVNQGAELRGFSIRYEDYDCLLTVRADLNGIRHVAFINSDTIMNCIIRASSAAAGNRLSWQRDKYFDNGS